MVLITLQLTNYICTSQVNLKFWKIQTGSKNGDSPVNVFSRFRYSIEKFLLPCLGEYVGSALSLCCFQLSSTLCKCCGELRFTDKEFPPVGASVGGDFAADPEVEWFRVSEIVTSTGKGGTIEGGDAEQAHLFGKFGPRTIPCWGERASRLQF